MLYWIIFFALLFLVYGLHLRYMGDRLMTAAYIRGEDVSTVSSPIANLNRIYTLLRPIMPGQHSMKWVGENIVKGRLKYTPEQILALAYACAVIFGGLVMIYGLTYFADKSIVLVITLIGGLAGGAFPILYVYTQAEKAIAQREREVLPLIQQLKILAKSGVGTTFNALASVVVEDEDSLLSRDFREAIHQGVQTGDRRKALIDMIPRTGSKTVKEVVGLILEAEAKEIPLYDVLEGLETTLLNDIDVKASDAQAKAEDRMAIPLAAFLLPANLLIIIGPGILNAKAIFNF